MKKIILIFAILVSFAAQAYEPMIREDRIWEYEHFQGYEEPTLGELTRTKVFFKFDGTVKIKSDTYHILKRWFPEDENSEKTTVAYMREEDGGWVFTILLQENLKIICPENLTCQMNGIPKNTEVLLYDFNPFGSYQYPMTNIIAMSDVDSGSECDLDVLVSFVKRTKMDLKGRSWNVIQSTVSYRELEDWPSTENACMASWSGGQYVTVVEGVGNIGRGYLHLPSSRPRYPSHFAYLDDSRFIRLTDLDGNVIFDSEWLDPEDGIEDVSGVESRADGRVYDLTGKQIEQPEPGSIFIRNGKKEIAR